MELTLQFAHMWWAGFRVFCRWLVFEIVMSVLGAPIGGLTYLMGSDNPVSMVIGLLLAPIPFYFTSKYLHLLEDSDAVVARAAEASTEAGRRKAYGLGTKILISAVVAWLGGFILQPSPDPISGLFLGTVAVFLCGVPLLILSRFQFLRSASSRKQTWVCVLICLAAIFATLGYVVLMRGYKHAHVSRDTPVVSLSQ